MNHKSWAIAFSVFLLLVACGSFGHCIICLSSIHDLWFIWPLYYVSFFYSWLVVHLAIVLTVFLLFMTCDSFGDCIICLYSVHDLWFIWPLYYLSFFCSWLVVHLAIVLSVFLLFMTCGSFGHCIICLSSIRDLWFIWPLYYLSFFCSYGQMNHKSWTEQRQIIQLANEPQVMNRRKTDNTMAKWTTSYE
jgi:hypothetical protein